MSGSGLGETLGKTLTGLVGGGGGVKMVSCIPDVATPISRLPCRFRGTAKGGCCVCTDCYVGLFLLLRAHFSWAEWCAWVFTSHWFTTHTLTQTIQTSMSHARCKCVRYMRILAWCSAFRQV